MSNKAFACFIIMWILWGMCLIENIWQNNLIKRMQSAEIVYGEAILGLQSNVMVLQDAVQQLQLIESGQKQQFSSMTNDLYQTIKQEK